jgi:dTDP-4-dehydrorhamnose 3,5-epimerase
MTFEPLELGGAYLIRLEPREDERGLFARTYCQDEFARQGLTGKVVQCNLSTNIRAGIVRGMHYQRPPHAEVKLVRCTRGAIHDVIVDLRKDSPTFGDWFGAELSEQNGLMMYVPEGFAHGYQSLSDGATALYMVTSPYAPHAEGGLRYDDPAVGIVWPLPVSGCSEKDGSWPDLISQV